MSAAVTRALLTAESISLIEHERLVDHESAGATVGSVGNVRDHDGGKTVLRLEYSAHPSAQQVLTDGAAHRREADGVRAVAVSHRIGALTVGKQPSWWP